MPNVLAVALAAIAISAAVAVVVPHRGFFAQLSHLERSLYFFIVLAADRNGVSFYAHDRICTELGSAVVGLTTQAVSGATMLAFCG
jgi:hypothetical protein